MKHKSKGLLLIIISVSLVQICVAQKSSKKDLWQSWEEITTQWRAKKKPILIDVYTTWCHYCKLMDATTYRNDSVVRYMKEKFYRFKFNAESRDTIYWQGNQYVYNQRYEVHDFAVYLSKGNIVYPTTVIIVPTAQPYFQFGQLKTQQLETLLKFFGTDTFKNQTIEEFAKTFTPLWK
jgi:uncharacterized protein YyaL (SSP411 family)